MAAGRPANPVAVWEIKEYYYTTTFGSRVADGVYDTLLGGMELEEPREHEGMDVSHYVVVDARHTWWDCGRSYLCRMVDMLHMAVDEVLFGYEVLKEMPRIMAELVALAREQSWEVLSTHLRDSSSLVEDAPSQALNRRAVPGTVFCFSVKKFGGEYRNRTGVHGFAIRCVTTPPTRRWIGVARLVQSNLRGKALLRAVAGRAWSDPCTTLRAMERVRSRKRDGGQRWSRSPRRGGKRKNTWKTMSQSVS